MHEDDLKTAIVLKVGISAVVVTVIGIVMCCICFRKKRPTHNGVVLMPANTVSTNMSDGGSSHLVNTFIPPGVAQNLNGYTSYPANNTSHSTGNMPHTNGNVPQATGDVPYAHGNMSCATGNMPHGTGGLPHVQENISIKSQNIPPPYSAV